MMTFGTTIISYFELTLPLPASRTAWFTVCEASWETVRPGLSYKESVGNLSITDCLADLSQLAHLSNVYDQSLSRLLLLCAMAPMIQTYRHLHMAPSWSGGLKSSGDSFTDHIHYHWLLRPFENLKMVFELYETDAKSLSTTAILMETLHLHLHTPLDHLELLTEREGPKELQASYATIQRWAKSRMARQSLWHAGQVLRKLRDLPAKHTTDPHSIIVYQSLLCLWAYALAMGKKNKVDAAEGQAWDETAQNQSICIPLDSQECPDTKKWIVLGQGQPVISIKDENALFDEPRLCSIFSTLGVARHCVDIIKSKYHPRTVLPPTADKTCLLIHNVGNITQIR
jgi:hypothetical protein